MINPIQLMRTSDFHAGSAAVSLSLPVSPVDSVQTPLKNQNTSSVSGSSRSFQSYLVEAAEYVNGKQNASDAAAQQLIIDPESIDIHDVTVAMAEASLSLNMAQSVIDRIIKGWNEITTSR